ncbi:MAG TPA: hypothetical protein VEB39_05015 [Sphingomicrobium sp.]|nr:hypothetical protein [Sphingomicrobium sp.]
MQYDLTVQGLIRKRAEIAGQVEAMHCQLASLMNQLNALDQSIRVFKPDIDLADLPERIPPAPFTAFRGEFQRFLLEELRKANKPRTTFELAEAVCERRSLDAADKIVFRLIARRTGYALSKMRRAGKVRSRRICGNGMMEWALST